MSNLLTKLSTATETLNEQEIIDTLKIILAQGTDIEIRNSDVLKNLLKINKNEIIKLTTEVIAEWAKLESNRKILTNEEIINALLVLLENSDVDVIFNAIRALGNICYENEEACNIINKTGIKSVLAILKKDSEREDKSLTMKTAGLLVNLFSLHDGLPRTALKSKVVPLLEQLLIKYYKPFEENQILLTFLLSILSSLSDYFDEQNVPFTEGLCQVVIDIFKVSTNPEISVTCLEIFHGQSEKDEIKTLLAIEGVCELLFELIEKYRHQVNDEESRSVLKMACDLIVVILTGDDCMYMLYNDGVGKVYLNMITWLESDDSDLLSTGILAIGNFARKDVHCIQMVKNGISKKLISSAALDLISRVDFLERLVYWCYNSDHLGVRGEVPRLLAWLIKHCHSFKPFENLLSVKDCVKCIVEMISSNHAVMQNEAFYALNLLCIGCSHSNSSQNGNLNYRNDDSTDKNIEKLMKEVVNADIGKNLNFVINKYGEKMDKQTIDNLLTLLEQLVKSKAVIDHFNSTSVKDVLGKISSNPNAQNISEKFKSIVTEITQ
ncbi:hypothetical protein NQ314_011484 [Rhamnusium bicolor]|uniref:Rap1 GTPase-GDP dissociation stimulator 1-B n=1 Tax=Rhamnusium bicolor TaxID=1586634 RepID=A0AAV8XIW2_9CUCU|nr:hypothetical protein NQ314_011484 [Rhamnusium bicolor]